MDTETLETEEQQEVIDEPTDTDPPAGEDESQGEEQTVEEQDDEVIVSIGEQEDDSEPEPLLPELRSRLRKIKSKYKKAQHELEQLKKSEPAPSVGPKPTIEQCDYDTDAYDRKLDEWYQQKRKSDAEAERVKAAQQREMDEWQKVQDNYHRRKINLRVKDYGDAEENVIDALSVEQQNIILQAADKPELVVYALGKSPKKLAEMAQLNPYKFAKELGKLEDKLKVSKRKPKTQPEKQIKSTGTLSGTTDRTLEKLREEAARTGNMSKVLEYKRKKRRAAAG